MTRISRHGAWNQENFGEISLLQLSGGDNQLGKMEEEHDIGHWQGGCREGRSLEEGSRDNN